MREDTPLPSWGFERAFTPDTLDPTTIVPPLLQLLSERGGTDRVYDIIVDVNGNYPGGREMAQQRIRALVDELMAANGGQSQGVHSRKTHMTQQYVFARMRGDLIQALVQRDREAARSAVPSIHRIWPDFEVQRLTHRSIATIRADAAHSAFGAFGEGIVWAVLDSGIDASHPHFDRHKNLDLPEPLKHCDFTVFGEVKEAVSERMALTDEAGHGTHISGIIAGDLSAGPSSKGISVEISATVYEKDEHGEARAKHQALERTTPPLTSFRRSQETGSR